MPRADTLKHVESVTAEEPIVQAGPLAGAERRRFHLDGLKTARLRRPPLYAEAGAADRADRTFPQSKLDFRRDTSDKP